MRRFTYSLLTDLHIWDPTIDELIRAFPGFRFLRYNTQGYESSSNEPVDVDVLADDLAGLLDSLGVQSCFAAVGVSLGGVTCMNFTIRYPSRLDKYIACDYNVASSDNNSKAWVARVSLARSEGGLVQVGRTEQSRDGSAPHRSNHRQRPFRMSGA